MLNTEEEKMRLFSCFIRIYSLNLIRTLFKGDAAMPQTIVNFLVKSGSSLVLDPRVFDFEIAADSKDVYLTLMNQLGVALASQDTTSIQGVLQKLSEWSEMISVENGSQITKTGYNFTTGEYYDANNPIPTSPTSDVIVTTTMNRYMAEYVDRLIRTFRSAGWDPITDDPSTAATALAAIQANPSIYQIVQYINLAISAANQAVLASDASTQSQSLQQLLMVDYISRGNELLYSQMQDLQTAIDLNQNALSYLNSLQDLMNQKDPQQFLMQLQILSTTTPSNLSSQKYTDFENQSFNQQLGTISKFTQGQITNYINTIQSLGLTGDTIASVTPEQYQQMVGTVSGSFLDLSTLQDMSASFNATNNGISTILNNLSFLINTLSNVSGGSATSLITALKTIQTDFQTLADQKIETAVINWVQDTGINREGDYQRHLNDAIVASQSLNDTKREELRRVMFIFEEFYKSATSMLSRITQLIEKMAGAIAR